MRGFNESLGQRPQFFKKTIYWKKIIDYFQMGKKKENKKLIYVMRILRIQYDSRFIIYYVILMNEIFSLIREYTILLNCINQGYKICPMWLPI